MELSLSFLFITITIFILFALSKLFSSSHNAPLPPGPTPLPIIGNLVDLDGQAHRSFARLAKVYGPIMSLKLGLTPTIVVSSAEVAREVLQTKDKFFSARLVPDVIRAGNQHEELIGGSSDSTTSTIEWAMSELVHDPVAMAKAQAEVRKAFASRTFTESDAINLPYLEAVIKEVMRLHPGGSVLPHKAMKDGVDLSGYRVPKGTSVLVNAWAIGRNPQLWIEPDVFRPERFLEKQISFHGKDFEFFPFGSGKRTCPGFSFAVRVVPFVLALMLAEFDWKLPDGMEPIDMDMTEKFGVVLKMAVPLRVVPSPVNI